MSELKVVLWRSPAGRLHRHRLCSGNGRSRETKTVKVTVEQFDAAKAEQKVCKCVMSDPFGRPDTRLKLRWSK